MIKTIKISKPKSQTKFVNDINIDIVIDINIDLIK